MKLILLLGVAFLFQACLTNDGDRVPVRDSLEGAWILAHTESYWFQDGVWNEDTVDLDTDEEYSMRLRVVKGDSIIYAQYLMDGKHFDTLGFVTLDDTLRLFNQVDTVQWSFTAGRLVFKFRRQRFGQPWIQYNHLIPYNGTFPPPSWSTALPPDAWEPDNVPEAAVTIMVGGQPSKRTLHVGDLDWMRFTAVAGVTYVIETFGNTDTFLEVYGSSSALILAADDDSGEGLNARLVWTATESGTAYFKVRRYGDYSVGPYRVSVRAQTAS